MASSIENLQNIAALACLKINHEEINPLTSAVNNLMDLAEKLTKVDTQNIDPLLHPFDLHQRLRSDVVTETNVVANLAAIAPEFSNQLYLVPKMIENK